MNKKIVLLTLLLILVISFSFLYFFERLQKIETRIDNLVNLPALNNTEVLPQGISDNEINDCGEVCKQVVDAVVSKAIATISGKTKIVETKNTSEKTPQTAYVPMGTTYTTTSTDWYTINDTAIYIDLINDYGANATVSWEGSLKVAYGNGQAFARLWDDTNKIAVNGSELTTINNSAYSLVSSKDLPFWRGRNLYKLQIKSLNSFEVSLTGGKIKIQY